MGLFGRSTRSAVTADRPVASSTGLPSRPHCSSGRMPDRMRTPARSANAKSIISSAGRAMCADRGAGSARAVDDLHCMSCPSCKRSTPTERGGTPSSTRSATSCAGTTSRRDGSVGEGMRSDLISTPSPSCRARIAATRPTGPAPRTVSGGRARPPNDRCLPVSVMSPEDRAARSPPPPADRTRQGSPGWPQLRPKHRCHRA